MVRRLTVVLTLTGCAQGCTQPAASDLDVTVSETVRTVATATWTESAASSRIVVADADGGVLASDWFDASDDPHSSPLLGLTASSDWTAYVETDAGRSDGVDFQTGAAPTELPTWTTDGKPGWTGYLSFSLMDEDAAAMVLDETGQVVWYAYEPCSHVLRVHPRVDGKGVLYNLFLVEDDAPATPYLVWRDWDGAEFQRAQMDGMTHDFVELADGTVAYLQSDYRAVDGIGPSVEGNRIVERSPDGTEREVYTTWDTYVPLVDGSVGEDGDWTHANALDLDTDESVYTLGFYGLDGVIQVDRATGEVLRQIGGPQSDYEMLPGAAFADQHQFQWLDDDTLLLFDNATSQTGSRALQIDLDDAAWTATNAWQWAPPDPLWSPILGDVDRAADGSTLITWSAAGVITDIGPDDAERWRLSSEFGQFFGFVERSSTLPGMRRLR